MTRAGAVMVAVAVLAGCHHAESHDALLVAGAKAMESYTSLLADAFGKTEAGTTIVVEAGGAAASVIALKRGAIDVATMPRDVSEREDDALLRNYLVARDGIAILVNRANPVTTVTMAQLRRIYAREITSWRDLGGGDAPIDLVVRDDASHTERSVRDILLGGDRMPKGQVASSREQMIAMVEHDANALGFSALAGAAGDVAVLDIDGVPLTKLTVMSGRYPLSRSFYLALYGSSSPAAERFVSFAIGPQGQDLLERAGLLPVY